MPRTPGSAPPPDGHGRRVSDSDKSDPLDPDADDCAARPASSTSSAAAAPPPAAAAQDADDDRTTFQPSDVDAQA